MAGSKSDAYENDVLRAAVGKATTVITTTPLTDVHVALYTGAAAADGPGTEATGGGYTRQATAAANWADPSGGSMSNSATISFTQFTGAVSGGAAITHFALVRGTGASPAVLYWGDLADATKTFGSGDTASFPAGSLTLTEG